MHALDSFFSSTRLLLINSITIDSSLHRGQWRPSRIRRLTVLQSASQRSTKDNVVLKGLQHRLGLCNSSGPSSGKRPRHECCPSPIMFIAGLELFTEATMTDNTRCFAIPYSIMPFQEKWPNAENAIAARMSKIAFVEFAPLRQATSRLHL